MANFFYYNVCISVISGNSSRQYILNIKCIKTQLRDNAIISKEDTSFPLITTDKN